MKYSEDIQVETDKKSEGEEKVLFIYSLIHLQLGWVGGEGKIILPR